MHPAVFEAVTLALMGSSGVGLGLLLGVRHWAPLAFLAVAATTMIRTWTAFVVWAFERPQWTYEAWLVTSFVVLAAALILHWRQWRHGLLATVAFGVGSVVALATKYLFDLGERHHSDSSNVLALAVVAIQGEMENTEPLADSFKRGIGYPLMLGLGPEGRILSAYTPLLYLALLGAAIWIAWTLPGNSVKWPVFAGVVVVLGLFSLSVPMFRAAMFYLNGHTLMGFGLVVLVGGLLIARKQQMFSALPMAMVVLGGSVGATARIEGIVLVLAMVAALTSQTWWSTRADRIRFFVSLIAIGLSLTGWLVSLDSPVLEDFGLSGWLLLTLTAGGAILAASPWIDWIRRWLFPLLSLVLAGLLAAVVWQSGNPLAAILTQWPNLGLGRGGWATAALVFGGSIAVLGWRRRSDSYRWLLIISIVLIGAVLFTKTFDGGFGREGFYDSVNRMWLHVMPTIILMTLVGYAELMQSALQGRSQRLRHRRHKSAVAESVSQ